MLNAAQHLTGNAIPGPKKMLPEMPEMLKV